MAFIVSEMSLQRSTKPPVASARDFYNAAGGIWHAKNIGKRKLHKAG
jgi:hypothetical protein